MPVRFHLAQTRECICESQLDPRDFAMPTEILSIVPQQSYDKMILTGLSYQHVTLSCDGRVTN